MNPWICCQIGAREHYAIPRALHQNGQLQVLLTDTWVSPQSALNRFGKLIPQTMRDRYHPSLPDSAVKDFSRSLVAFEIVHKVRRLRPWPTTVRRNRWFQKRAIQYLDTLGHDAFIFSRSQSDRPILFTYSYAALDLLRYAKARGWKTVLGQIDPGIVEERIVINEHQRHPNLAPVWERTPAGYWDSWKSECAIADSIIVNSQWSKQALEQVGVLPQKISIVPLAYSPSPAAEKFTKVYPEKFVRDRPLRVLFLGQILLRKGIVALLEAAQQLQGQPIEFWIVGRIDIDTTQFIQPNIRWIGPVSRSDTARYYQQADVFVLPTLSDGFALTQLEAQSWRLPVIASRFCGSVVQSGHNGFLLPEVSGEAIAQILQRCVSDPALLQTLSGQSKVDSAFSLSELSSRLQQLTAENV